MVVTRATAFTLAVIGVIGLLTVSCSPAPRPLPAPDGREPTIETTSPSPAPVELRDPLIALDDPGSPEYLDDRAEPVLHREGVGPETFTVEVPEDATSLSIHIACEPVAEFRVDAAGTFFAGSCAPGAQQSADIPVDPGTKTLEMTLTLPGDVRRFLVALPGA